MEDLIGLFYRKLSELFVYHITVVLITKLKGRNSMSKCRKITRFLIPVEELEVKFKGRYTEEIDKNLKAVITEALRDCADGLIPKMFRDESLTPASHIGSHLMLWLKTNLTFSENIDPGEELLELIEDCAYLLDDYRCLKGKLVHVCDAGQHGYVLVRIVGDINQIIIDRYRSQITKLIQAEELNPLQTET